MSLHRFGVTVAYAGALESLAKSVSSGELLRYAIEHNRLHGQ
jgi:hypothetical protein